MVDKKYYTIEEALTLLGSQGLTLGGIGSYTRERLIHPIIYINSKPAYACEEGTCERSICEVCCSENNDKKSAIAVGYCFISAYWDLGIQMIAIMDNLISSENGTFDIFILVKAEQLIGKPEIFSWQYHERVFDKAPFGHINPKPFSDKLKHFILITPDNRTFTLKLANILIPSTDVELLRTHLSRGLIIKPSLPNQISIPDKEGKRAKPKTNPLNKLIADIHQKSSNKSPEQIWSELKRLCDDDIHPILQEVTPWDEGKATIVWQSHREKERSMGRARFENIISELNNPD
jgi:hypothetical protein